MKLASILSGVLLVIGLTLAACDGGGGGDGGSEDTIYGGEDTNVEPGVDTTDAGCEAACTGKCGTVGECECGGCEEGFECVEATHVCAPVVEPPDCDTACAGKECGDGGADGCNCGACTGDETCNVTTGMCEAGCQADCTGKQCGEDGCGGPCGLCPCVGCDPEATTCEANQCVAPEALDCAGINLCMGPCGNDQDCAQTCFNQGSTEAQEILNALIQCLIDNGAQQCPPGDTMCQQNIIEEHCTPQYEACFPPGTMTCSEMFDCMTPCGQDQDCLQQCFMDSTTEAQNQYNAIAACVIEQCGEQPTQECFNAAQEGACAAVFADCFNLGKPGFATGPNGAASENFANLKMFLLGLDKDKLYNHH